MRKILLGIMWIVMSFFILGCSNMEKNLYGFFNDKNIEEKYKDKEKYIQKLSSTIVNMRVDGSINNMREVSETGKIDSKLFSQLEVSDNFFQCLIDDFNNLSVPEEFSTYNEEILDNLKKAKDSLDVMLVSKDENSIKENAKVFIQSNKEISNIVDRLLIYYENC